MLCDNCDIIMVFKREIKSHVEVYARQREEEKEILRMTQEKRKEMERDNRKLSANDVLRLQERVS